MNVTVDFNKTKGAVKPLNSACIAPYSANGGDKYQGLLNKIFTEANIPYCRLHDCQGAYGGTYYVDITNVFPDFGADENDPDSYDFHYTDEYIGEIAKTGCEAYYRLGETIEWGSKKYSTVVPPDFSKWARICEHIVRHYNEGWADGFHYDLTYWEIWNEPENPGNAFGPCMWQGTKEEFFSLYETASKHLKKCFSNIKVGGYGSCGFYPVTRESCPESFKSFVPYFTDFLKMVKSTGAPLDFFSWHIYTADVNELLSHAKFVRETLDSKGFTATEAHLNEWNIHAEGSGFSAKHTMEGASFNGAVLAALSNTDYVDVACYYSLRNPSAYNGFIDQNDSSIDPPFYSFVAYGRLLSLGTYATSEADGVYAVAAKGDGGGAVMLSNYDSDESEVNISFSGAPGDEAHVYMLDGEKLLSEVFSVTVPKDGKLKLLLPKQTLALVEFK